MTRKLWSNPRQFTLCTAMLLSLANLASAQDAPRNPTPPPGSIAMPASAQTTPNGTPQAPSLAAPVNSAPVSNQAIIDEMKARLDQQDKIIAEQSKMLDGLQQRLMPAITTTAGSSQEPIPVPPQPVPGSKPPTGLTPQDIEALVGSHFARQEQQRRDERAEGYRVGSDLAMTATWIDGVWFSTRNKDFYFHIGGEMQYDSLFFQQSPALLAAKGGSAVAKGMSTGDSKGGLGELVDSDEFRRLRLWAEGGFWEVGEFMFQPKLEKIQNGQIALDQMWVGVKDIPLFGSIRLGHHKTPQGLESDDWSSNMTFTYMERSTMSNAFYQNFGTGIVFTNNIAPDQIGQRATYAAMFYRPQDGENGAAYADGDYAFTGRLSGLPIYMNDGRCLLHLALSATYRHNRNGNATVNATPEMFDFNGGDNGYGVQTAVNGTNVTNMNPSVNGVLAGNKNPNGANAAALVSTGAITSTAETVFGSELLYINGPFSIQAEYAVLTFVDSVGAGGFKGSTGNLTVSGGYIAVSYLLTGENRTYDTRLGRLGTNYLEVRTPFWLVRDANGYFNGGLGAWELEARFSHLDLNTHDINGGETDALNLGLVWHLNNNVRVTFDYLRQNRYDLPNGVNSGWLSGFGVRTQLIF